MCALSWYLEKIYTMMNGQKNIKTINCCVRLLHLAP